MRVSPLRNTREFYPLHPSSYPNSPSRSVEYTSAMRLDDLRQLQKLRSFPVSHEAIISDRKIRSKENQEATITFSSIKSL